MSDPVSTASPFPTQAPNAYLSGAFAPTQHEIARSDLLVVGKLPQDLNGMWVRNGPNPMFPPASHYHWFDGDGMLHGVRIEDGKASYLNRFVRTSSWMKQQQSGRNHSPSYVNARPLEHLQTLAQGAGKGGADFFNKANTSLVWHHGKLFALWEAGSPYEIRPEDLETVGPDNFFGARQHAVTAHPKIDPVTGELLFFGNSLRGNSVRYGILDRAGRLVHQTTIPVGRIVMMHDFAITRRYSIFFDFPMLVRPLMPLVGRAMLRYRADRGARIGILPRYGSGDQVRWFDVEPGFLFHVLNAWENDDTLTLYACRFPGAPGVLNRSSTSRDQLQLDASMYRWVIDLKSGSVVEGAVDDRPAEFPRVDDAVVGAQSRYGYAASFLSNDAPALVKYDLNANTSQRHEFAPSQLVGEGIFVPRPNQVSEDDGYLVSMVHDEADDRSEFVILDCRRFDNDPVIARIPMPQRVPAGFHGVWMDGDSFSSA